MATAEKTVAILRRNHTPWRLPRQQQLQIQQTNVALPAQITTSTDPALAPLGTELALYTSEFNSDPVWNWVNQGTSTVTFGLSRVFLMPQLGGAATNNLRMFGPPSFPPAPWAVRIRMINSGAVLAGTGGGFAIYRPSNGRIHTPQVYLRASLSGGTVFSETWAVNDWSSPTAINATRYGPNNENERSRDRYLQVRCDGTTLFFDFSADNAYFVNVTSTTLATYLGGTGTDLRVLLLGNDPNATADGPVAYDWFRTYGNANLNQ